MAFGSGGDNTVRVDYRKYINGWDDYSLNIKELNVPKEKCSKTVWLEDVNKSKTWTFEDLLDVQRYLKNLERELHRTLEYNTVVTLEF